MAPRPHLQASASAARQEHDQNVMELVTNCSFTLTTGSGTCSRLTPQKWHSTGIGLVPLLYNIYTYDLPTSASHKYAYADDLAEGVLGKDLATLAAYLQTWQLTLSWSKTVSAAFHLNNREAGCKLNISLDGKYLPFSQIPTYLGVKLDRSLTYHQHLES